jgi:membrane protease YdiL (CAAX protease family)
VETTKKILGYSSVLVLLFIGLQIMNRILIFIGNQLIYVFKFRTEYEILYVGIIQQLIQFSLAIILIRIFVKKDIYTLGFNFGKIRQSIQYFMIFALLILIVILVYDTITYLFFKPLWGELQNSVIPTATELRLKLVFQSIFPGLGEESLFRGFLISFLVGKLQLNLEEKKSKIFLILISALFFSIAHVYYDIKPFRITHFEIDQLCLAFFSGILYSFMYLKTKSLLGPILSHNFSNVAMTISSYIVAII